MAKRNSLKWRPNCTITASAKGVSRKPKGNAKQGAGDELAPFFMATSGKNAEASREFAYTRKSGTLMKAGLAFGLPKDFVSPTGESSWIK